MRMRIRKNCKTDCFMLLLMKCLSETDLAVFICNEIVLRITIDKTKCNKYNYSIANRK